MILFVADSHYGQHCGSEQSQGLLKRGYDIAFHEDDWSALSESFVDRADLLVLNMIAHTCNVPAPDETCEPHVREYVDSGKPLLLLHGASAAFWHWDWWRPIVGYRWVRGEDPDGGDASWHPKRPYKVDVAKCRHPLTQKLKALDLPTDEIYLNLEQTAPAWTLMTTTTDEGTFPMCYESRTPTGGRVIGFLPGHCPEVTSSPEMIETVSILIDDLLSGPTSQ